LAQVIGRDPWWHRCNERATRQEVSRTSNDRGKLRQFERLSPLTSRARARRTGIDGRASCNETRHTAACSAAARAKNDFPRPVSTRLQIRVDYVLQELLSAGIVGSDVALFEHVFFQRGEAVLAGIDPRADARVPRAVALLEHLVQDAVGANSGGDL